jgi:hypothetical protein
LTLWRTFGAEVGIPLFLTFLADAYGEAGQPEEGLKQIAAAARSVEVRNERIYEAEMHRIQGELRSCTSATKSFGSVMSIVHVTVMFCDLEVATFLGIELRGNSMSNP